MIRARVFGTTMTIYRDPAYKTAVLGISTLFGLWLMREDLNTL